ncbi:hypothetical protein AN639_01695 [Candidatus Epulonipiscium fishelsonii]|uniref:Uncharacterized protein n=1 Tax=Candidatus Epulonipiscium fishelsonii TaxID=77094 RepID=A0ACC8XE44_9FIRM|nr:hypothetical protein AN639_01695 [Epulopiscium sp. SCG-B05WGA-EpuloA1]ONI41217.1 hypothetical protein AN396_03775 [Epulopiscium sp. SCG-B11WGA-EpuloA1]
MSMKRKLLILLLGSTMMVTACSQGTANNDVKTENNTSTESEEFTGPKDYRSWTTSMSTFNPHMYTNSKAFSNLGTFVAAMASSDGSNQLTFVPHHASELPTSSDGGTTWTIKIRDGLTWNDGTPLNAATYEYSMKMLLDPKLVNKNAVYMFDTVVVKGAKDYYAGNISWEDVGVKLINDNELQIVLEYPATDLDFFTSLGSLIWPVKEDLYEATMNEDRTSTTYATTLDTTPSAGMFTLTEWITEGHDVHVVNENDPLVKEGYVHLDSINRRYISSSATRSEMFFKNELDQHSLSGDEYTQYKNDPRANPTLSPHVWGYFVNGASENKIMQSQDFRNALHYATPRETICEDVYVLYPSTPYMISTGIYVGDPISGGEYYRDTAPAKAIEEKWATNPDKALELFNKAYEENGGTPVTVEYIYFEGQEDQKRQAEVLQESLENLFGKDRFTLALRAVPPAAAYDLYRSGDYDLGLGVRLANVFNPWATLNVWTSDYADKYITGFENEEFDELQFESVYGSLVNDIKGKGEALARMEELLLEYGAFVPVMQNDNTVMYHERMELSTTEYLPFIGYSTNQLDIISAP